MNNDKKYFERIAEHGQLVILSGPSGVGKRTVLNGYLAEHPNALTCTSVTTRQPRKGETDGVEHFFVSHLEFDRMVRSKQLLEYGYYNLNGYGTPRKAVEEARNKGHNVLLITDVSGAMRIRALCPDATLIFLLPPTWDDLVERIQNQDILSNPELEQRLYIAQEEIQCAEQYDYILINDTVENTVRRLGQIIHGNRYSRASMKPFMESYLESEIHSELVDVIHEL